MKILLLVIFASSTYANTLFKETKILNLEIQAPFIEMFDSKEKDYASDGVSIKTKSSELEAAIKLRGHNSLINCTFPKLKVHFEKKGVEPDRTGTVFEKTEEFKIHTHCGTDFSETNEGFRIKNEYGAFRLELVYQLARISDLATPLTRKARITYQDSSKNTQIASDKDSLIIQDSGRYAKENGLYKKPFEYESGKINPDFLDLEPLEYINNEQLITLALFNSMIGNWDWSLKGDEKRVALKNIELLGGEKDVKALRKGKQPKNKLVPFVHDYDLATMITGKYKVPREKSAQLHLAMIKEYFSGINLADTFANELAKFKSNKVEYIKLINNFSFSDLDKKGKGLATEHVEFFFKALEDLENISQTNTFYDFQCAEQ